MAEETDCLSAEERLYYKKLLDGNAELFVASDGSAASYQKHLGSLVQTPLGTVKMGANQYQKFLSKHREHLFIVARKTLEQPIVVFTAENGTRAYVKSFVTNEGRKKHVIAVTIVRDDTAIVITAHEERLNQILNKMKKTGILYEKAPGL